nr:immunoglobulin light chain junction region [Macaca mulatta]MOW18429.1 immunoglobulin light chain junction region [Macaca mulatta]
DYYCQIYDGSAWVF